MKVERARDGIHKYVATFKDGKKTSFGQASANDYTITGDKEARQRYRARHRKDLETGDPQRAGFLSYYLLWGDSTSLEQNIKEYRKRFNF